MFFFILLGWLGILGIYLFNFNYNLIFLLIFIVLLIFVTLSIGMLHNIPILNSQLRI